MPRSMLTTQARDLQSVPASRLSKQLSFYDSDWCQDTSGRSSNKAAAGRDEAKICLGAGTKLRGIQSCIIAI